MWPRQLVRAEASSGKAAADQGRRHRRRLKNRQRAASEDTYHYQKCLARAMRSRLRLRPWAVGQWPPNAPGMRRQSRLTRLTNTAAVEGERPNVRSDDVSVGPTIRALRIDLSIGRLRRFWLPAEPRRPTPRGRQTSRMRDCSLGSYNTAETNNERSSLRTHLRPEQDSNLLRRSPRTSEEPAPLQVQAGRGWPPTTAADRCFTCQRARNGHVPSVYAWPHAMVR
jgi:hypothetical protein